MNYHHTCSDEGSRKYKNYSVYGCECRSSRRGGFCFAMMLIGVGTLFLLQHLNLLGGYSVIQFWPLLIVIPALSHLIRARSWGGRVFALLALVFADLALASSLQLVAVSWGLIWPVFVVAMGALILAKVVLFPGKQQVFQIPETMATNSELLHTKIVCGGNEEDFGAGEFKGGIVDVFMGGYELDLRAARMEQESAQLYVKVKLAGVKIRVPQEWQVLVEGETFLGAIENNTTSHSVGHKHELRVVASVHEGALEIEN